MKTYSYTVHILDGQGNVHRVSGSVCCKFENVFDSTMLSTMSKLSIECDGKTCSGPYEITYILITLT